MVNVLFSDTTAGILNSLSVDNDDIILTIDLMLDVGYLNEGIESKYRRELPRKMIDSCYEYKIKENMSDIGDRSIDNLDKLKVFIQEGHEVCIWYEKIPHSLCSFYFLCCFLKELNPTIYFNPCPEIYTRDDGTIVFLKSWGQLQPHEILHFTDRKNMTASVNIQFYADRWYRLVSENAPLRTNIGNCVISVPDNFYDPLINMYITNTPIKESEVIGSVLGKSELPVNCCIIHDRIQHMIYDGIIRVTNSYDPVPIQRYIRKSVPDEILKGHNADIEERILEELIYNAHISQTELAEGFNLPLSRVRNILKRFKDQGKITRIDGNSHGYWRVNGHGNT